MNSEQNGQGIEDNKKWSELMMNKMNNEKKTRNSDKNKW